MRLKMDDLITFLFGFTVGGTLGILLAAFIIAARVASGKSECLQIKGKDDE